MGHRNLHRRFGELVMWTCPECGVQQSKRVKRPGTVMCTICRNRFELN